MNVNPIDQILLTNTGRYIGYLRRLSEALDNMPVKLPAGREHKRIDLTREIPVDDRTTFYLTPENLEELIKGKSRVKSPRIDTEA